MNQFLRDAFGRSIRYLRVSVTDKCNLRCKYCVSKQCPLTLPRDEILSFEEIEFLVRVMAKMGVKKIRLTGGEPLLRRDLQSLVRNLRSVPGVDELCLTTNGILFADMAAGLKKAGLSRVNISLDTLSEEKFLSLTGFDGLAAVLKSVETSLSLGFKTKVNCVLGSWNEEEIFDLALLAKDNAVDIRFIELMPIGGAFGMKGLSSDCVLRSLEERFGKANASRKKLGETARLFYFDGFKGRVGFISPVSKPFCDECDRLRLLSDGRIKLCLCSNDFIDTKNILRSNQNADTIENCLSEKIFAALKRKPKARSFACQSNGLLGNMSQIGG